MKTISRKVQMEKEREKTDILKLKHRIFSILHQNVLGMLEKEVEVKDDTTPIQSAKVEWTQLSKVEKNKMTRLKRKPCRERTWAVEMESS